MLVLIVALADKYEVYTLYSRAGPGFVTTTRAYLGKLRMKELSLVKPEIPTASAPIFPLRQIFSMPQTER